ncbi:MAG TPA: hypothetical protein VFA57_16410 [Pseudolabrys sp.]|nr:hypothetical protein [Pseudolabrys sp.]
MKEADVKKLCLELIKADSEEDVVAILKEWGLWDNPVYWRYYGDDELNWNRAGNQQARADFALNEKLVNTIDSRLMLECMLAGINPEDETKAPKSMREAVNRFIEKTWRGTLKVTGGRVEEWPTKMRTQVAEGISVFVTGPKGLKPCVNVADLGEGQTPEAFPLTLLSLGKRNKFKVRFAQGKYGQGSSGALRFCGKRKLQLIVSKRHPKLVKNSVVRSDYPTHSDDDCWGVTVVRREGEGMDIPTPFLSYLAPIDADNHPRAGRVLRFRSDEMPLFPKGDDAYQRSVPHGTLVKLYEYNLPTVSNILRRAGLRPKIDLLLPEPALPMRFHECREHQKSGHEQVETMSGLFARLNGNQNLEDIKPAEITVTVQGHELVARIFAFKPGTSDTYRNAEGVVFTINGQAQGYIKANIFARKKVGLQRLAKDLLVVLDCSSITVMEQHDMFMPSRDRLVEDNQFAMDVEKKIEEALRDHPGLRLLKNERRQADVQEQLADNKPLEDALKRVLKNSPTLARLFGLGQRLHNPFKPETKESSDKFIGKQHPTFFRFAGKEEGDVLARAAHLESKVRIAFDTDVVDDYFTRKVDRGQKDFVRIVDGKRVPLTDYSGPNLADGRANLTLDLPDGMKAGDVLELELIVRDLVTGAEFVNKAKLAILAALDRPEEPHPHKKKKPPADKPGDKQEGIAGLDFPEVKWVKPEDARWKQYFELPDDCLTIIDDGEVDENGKSEPDYTFYLNEGNKALQNELATTKLPVAAVKKQFEIGMMLVGMALLHDDKQRKSQKPSSSEEKADGEKKDETTVFKLAQQFSRAIAPVILPMIQSLGDLADDEADVSDLAGQAEAA